MGCIYQIRNILNGKIYVGSTWKPLRKRKSEHLTKLRTNKHSSPHLQNSFNKYGEDNFMFDLQNNFIKSFNNLIDVINEMGWKDTATNNVSAVLKGIYKQTHGYIFKYKEVTIG